MPRVLSYIYSERVGVFSHCQNITAFFASSAAIPIPIPSSREAFGRMTRLLMRTPYVTLEQRLGLVLPLEYSRPELTLSRQE